MQYKLTEEILKLSVSKDWEFAKKEWTFVSAYRSDKPLVCLCGHNPIHNICVIKNINNALSTEVGNCCINKFLDIDEANNIFESIKRLNSDISKSMSLGAITYLKNKNIVNDFEFSFYQNIINKRNLTAKQLQIKKRVNIKLLEFTNYNVNSQIDKINKVLEWSKKQTNFDASFLLSLKNSYESYGKLTDKQALALESIMNKLKLK